MFVNVESDIIIFFLALIKVNGLRVSAIFVLCSHSLNWLIFRHIVIQLSKRITRKGVYMQQLFNIDSKFMVWLCRFANLFLLNLLTVVCCLPVITVGAAFTAMHTVLLSIYHHEDDHILKRFFKAFLTNFRQATVIWLISLLHMTLLVLCLYYISKGVINVPAILLYFLYASAILLIVLLNWVFILQGRYANPIWATIKNALIAGIAHPGCTIVMVALFICPFLILLATSQAEPFILCIGFSVPGFLQSKLYGKVIEKIDRMVPGYEEPKEQEE